MFDLYKLIKGFTILYRNSGCFRPSAILSLRVLVEAATKWLQFLLGSRLSLHNRCVDNRAGVDWRRSSVAGLAVGLG